MGSAGEQFVAGGDYQVGFTLAQAHEPVISTDGVAYTIVGGFWHGNEAPFVYYFPIFTHNATLQ